MTKKHYTWKQQVEIWGGRGMNLVGGMLMGTGIGTVVGIALSAAGEEVSQLGQGIKPTLKAALKSAGLNLAFTVGGSALGALGGLAKDALKSGGMAEDAEAGVAKKAEEGLLRGKVGVASTQGGENLSKADIGIASRESLPKGDIGTASTQGFPKTGTETVANSQGLQQADIGVAPTHAAGNGIQKAEVGVTSKLRKTSRWAKPNQWKISPAAQKETKSIAFAEEDEVYDLSPQYASDEFYKKQMDILRERLRNAETQEEKDAIEALRQDAINTREATVAHRTEFRARYTENVYLKRKGKLPDPF